jgi:hypothetical protein
MLELKNAGFKVGTGRVFFLQGLKGNTNPYSIDQYKTHSNIRKFKIWKDTYICRFRLDKMRLCTNLAECTRIMLTDTLYALAIFK